MVARSPGDQSASMTSRIIPIISSKAFLVVVDQFFVSSGSFFTAVMVGRVAGPSELAVYGLAVTVLWLISSFTNSAIWVPHTNAVPKAGERKLRRLELSATVHILVFSVSMALPSFVFAFCTGDWSFSAYVSIHLYLAGMLLREHIRRMNMAQKQILSMLMIDIPTVLVQVVAVIIMASNRTLTAHSALFVVGIVTISPFVIHVINPKLFSHSVLRSYIDFRRNWRLGGWLVCGSLLNSLTDLTVRIIIVNFASMASLGLFTAALTLSNILNPLILTSGNFLRVNMAYRISRHELPALKQLYFMAFRSFAVAGAALFGLIACFGEWGSSLFFGSQYQGLGAVITSSCLAMLFSTIFIVTEAMLTVFSHGYGVFLSVFIRMFTTITLGLVLSWQFGPTGANIAIAFGYLIAIVFQARKIQSLFANAERN